MSQGKKSFVTFSLCYVGCTELALFDNGDLLCLIRRGRIYSTLKWSVAGQEVLFA